MYTVGVNTAAHAPDPLDQALMPPVHTKAAFSMLRVAALISEELDRALVEQTGVGLNEVLVILQVMGSGERVKMADLADSLVVTRGGVTKIVDRLVKAGYLARVQSEEDRRVVYAELTEKAYRMIHERQYVVEEVTAKRIGGMLDETETEQLHDFMHRLSCLNPGWEPPGFDGHDH